MRPTAWSKVWPVAFAAALDALGTTAGCSSGGGGEPISCVAPGATCCAGNACAVGLACQNAVCVLVEPDAAIDGAPSDGSAGDRG